MTNTANTTTKVALLVFLVVVLLFLREFKTVKEPFSESAGPGTTKTCISTVRVCPSWATGEPCMPMASIYVDEEMTMPKANPFVTAADGSYELYAAKGEYILQFSGCERGIFYEVMPRENR